MKGMLLRNGSTWNFDHLSMACIISPLVFIFVPLGLPSAIT